MIIFFFSTIGFLPMPTEDCRMTSSIAATAFPSASPLSCEVSIGIHLKAPLGRRQCRAGGRQLEPIPYLLGRSCCAVGGWMRSTDGMLPCDPASSHGGHTMKVLAAVGVLLFVSVPAHAQAAKPCEELKDEITKKLLYNRTSSPAETPAKEPPKS